MKRRVITLLSGAAAAWPFAARAQQPERTLRIGVLMPYDENEPVAKPRLSAFTQALADLGWTDGRNVRMDFRWAGADTNRIRALAQELVSLQPDIIVTAGTPATVALQRETRTIPILRRSAMKVPTRHAGGARVAGVACVVAGAWMLMSSPH